MNYTCLNLYFMITVLIAWSNFTCTCNGLLHGFNGECNNCSAVVFKTHGTFMDCGSRNFYQVPNYCKVANIKQLLLDSNNIETVTKDAFQSMNALEVISLNRNKINFIHKKAFDNLFKLRELYIEYNKLNQQSFGKSVFISLRSLEVLHICENVFQYEKTHTLENAVSALKNLRSLHIQGFEGLEFRNTFQNLKKLKELMICGHNTIYDQRTFRGFVNNTIEYLDICAIILHKDTFKYFKHLKGLDVTGYDTIVNVLEALWPFQNNTFEYLRLGDNVGGFNLRPTVTLTSKHFQYLANICTLELNLKNNGILHITHLAFASLKHISCIKRLDLSGNMIASPLITEITLFRNLEYLNVCCIVHDRRKRDVANTTNKFIFWRRKQNKNVTRNDKTITTLKDPQVGYRVADKLTKNTILTENHDNPHKSFSNHINEFIYFINPQLQVINVSHNEGYDFPNITFTHGEGMTGIDASFCNFECNFFIQGVPNLIWFNISYWHCQSLIPSFLQYYPNLQVFVASHANLNKGLTNLPDGSLFKSLTKLEHVDLAYNNLRFLPSKLFQNQSKSLKSLILSGNFLFPVPNNLLNLTCLTYLDLSYNNYTLFTNSDIHVITTLTSRGTRIRLEGNKFICTCDTGDFIRWLFTIKTMIDFKRIYCVMNNGTLKFLTDMNNVRYDLDLGCSSKFWLIFSISGISVLTVALLLSVIAYRYRLDIEFFIFRCYWRLYPRQPFSDYQHDVFIAASKEDVPWVCRELIKFLDEQVKVKTFYYHKDALPAQSIGDMICENIQKSRKIIFVITDAFLKSPWLGFELDQARMYMYKMYSERNILIILKGDISIKKCPDIIKTLHSKILFLQYPIDESEEELNIFWKKLEKCFENHNTAQSLDAHGTNQIV